MKLMQAISTYQLLELIVYRNKYIFEEKVILLMPEWLKVKINNYKFLELMFTKVIVFKCFPDYKKLDVSSDIINYYNSLFEENEIKLEECDEIHVAGAHYGIGNYLCLKQIEYIYWEDSSGIISRPDILRDIENNLSADKMKFNDKLGLYDGKSPFVNKIFANISAQQGEIPDNVIDFDVVLEFGTLKEEICQKIISVFTSIQSIDIPVNTTLLLTEHFANCKRLTFEEQVLIYQLYFDYFLKGEKVIIKPHPDDLMYYDQLFPDVQIVREKFPAEFIPYIFSNRPKMLATISSAAVKALHTQFFNNLILDNDFEKKFYSIHKYYIALKLALELQEYEKINMLGIYKPMIENLYIRNKLTINEENKNLFHTQVYIIDDYGNEKKWSCFTTQMLDGDDNTCFVFLNSLEQYLFFDINKEEVWKKILPIIIHKSRISNRTYDFYSDLKDEYIYIYTKNDFLRERINQMNIEKKLDDTGISIEKEVLDLNSLQVEILKGKLKATEKRLLYYINLVKELEEKER